MSASDKSVCSQDPQRVAREYGLVAGRRVLASNRAAATSACILFVQSFAWCTVERKPRWSSSQCARKKSACALPHSSFLVSAPLAPSTSTRQHLHTQWRLQSARQSRASAPRTSSVRRCAVHRVPPAALLELTSAIAQTDLALATLATRTAAGLGIGVVLSALLFKRA